MESTDVIRDSAEETCTNCGGEVDSSDWHPVRASHDEDGEFRIFAFCSEECLGEWE